MTRVLLVLLVFSNASWVWVRTREPERTLAHEADPVPSRQATSEPIPPLELAVIMRDLDSNDATRIGRTLGPCGDRDLGPTYIDKIIEVAGRDATREVIFECVFARLDPKPARVVAAILNAEHVDRGNARMMREALQRGVPDHLHGDVADFFVRLLPLRSTAAIHMLCLDMLTQYGRPADIRALEEWAAGVELDQYTQARFDRTLHALRMRE